VAAARPQQQTYSGDGDQRVETADALRLASMVGDL